MVAEGEVEVLESSPDTLGGSGHSFASDASALLSQTFDAFHRVRRFKQEPRHQAPFSAVVSQQSQLRSRSAQKVSRHRRRGADAGLSDLPCGVGLDYCEVRNSRISARPTRGTAAMSSAAWV